MNDMIISFVIVVGTVIAIGFIVSGLFILSTNALYREQAETLQKYYRQSHRAKDKKRTGKGLHK